MRELPGSWGAAGQGGERASRRAVHASTTERREHEQTPTTPPHALTGASPPGTTPPPPAASGEGGQTPTHPLRPAEARTDQGSGSPYDAIAALYDDWSRQVTEDVGFYVEEALGASGPVVELGVGTGRIAVPTAQAGVPVIGVDSSSSMLERCRRRAADAGVDTLIDLRLGDYRRPPVSERVALVTCPFRSYLHLHTDEERLEAFTAAFELLQPGGRLVFDVFAPSRADIRETNRRWLEREPGIWERADWRPRRQRLDLSVRGEAGETTMELAWLSPERWQALIERAGLAVEGRFGWFDRRPYAGGEDVVFAARRPG
jgi:SAM-dependent methyltransferase